MTDTAIVKGGGVSAPVAGARIINYASQITEIAGSNILQTPQSAASTGDFNVTEATDSFSCSGVITHLFDMNLTEHADIWNDLSPVDQVPDSDITGWLGFFGPMDITEVNDTFTGAGPGHPPGLFASGDMLEVNDIFDGAGYADRIGTMAPIEAADILHGILIAPKQGPLSVTEAKDVFHGTVFTTGTSGALIKTEPVDIFHGVVFIEPRGTIAATELADRFAARAPGVVTIIRRLITVN